MTSIFTKIINREFQGYIIDEDEDIISFLDINPLTKGHCLIVPKKEVDYFFDLEDDLIKKIIFFSKKISIALKKTFQCKRVGMTVIGMEVPHAHIHLIPINSENEMNFSNKKLKMNEVEFKEILKKIKKNLS
tara:strand:+ start:54 stop:449 length:396 start_codon:yes stop_codon:yes gene_type:complete